MTILAGSTETGLDKKLDSQASETPDVRPPGSLWKHPKTGGWYWRIKSNSLPAEARGAGEYTNIPVCQMGRRHATKVRQSAEAARNRLWKQWRQTRLAGPSAAPKNLEHWIAEFKAWNLNRGTGARQVDYNAWIVRQFIAGQSVGRCEEITEEAVQHYLSAVREQGRSTRTIEAHRNTLFMFCRFLDIRHQLESNPVRLVEVASPDKRPPRFLTDRQIAAFLKHARQNAPGWLYAASCVGLYAGLRLGEIMALCWRDVRLAARGGSIVVGGSEPTKTGDYRIVPVIPQLARAMKTLTRKTDGAAIFPRHDKRWWGELFAELTEGLPVFGELEGSRAGNQWHLLRSTYAVQQARGAWTGTPATVWQLMAWMGHKNPQTTMRYVNIAQAAGLAKPSKDL
jgi:integrase